MRWRYKFDPDGGYDCLSSAFDVYENGRLRFSIDVADFVESRDRDWEASYAQSPEAEALAARVVQLLNDDDAARRASAASGAPASAIDAICRADVTGRGQLGPLGKDVR